MPVHRLVQTAVFLLLAGAVRLLAQDDTPALEDVTIEHRRGGDLGLYSMTLERRQGGDLGLHSMTLERRRGGDLGLHSVVIAFRRPVLAVVEGPANPGSADVTPGELGVPVLQLSLRGAAPGRLLTLSSLRFAASGSLDDPVHVAAVHLYVDENADGAVQAGEAVLATTTISGDNGMAAFEGLSREVPSGQSVALLVTADFAGSAPPEGTFALSLASPADVQGLLDGTIAVAGAGTSVAGATITVVPADSVPPTVTIDAPLEAETFFNAASITPLFSAADEAGGSGLKSVTARIDGVYPISSGQPFDVRALPLGSHVLSVVAFDRAGNQTARGVTFVLERFSVGYGPAQKGSGPVPQGTTNSTLLQFRLARAGGSGEMSFGAAVLAASGTGDDRGLLAVRLVEDTDGDGVADSGEPVLASGRFQQDDGLLTLDGFASSVPANGAKDYLVAYDLSGTESYGQTFAFTLGFVAATSGGASVTPVGLPLASREVRIDDVRAPVIAIDAPEDGLVVPNLGLLEVSFRAEDEAGGSGLGTVEADLDGQSVTSGQFVDLAALAIGTHRLVVTARDVAGNEATAEASFTVETLQEALQVTATKVQGQIDDPSVPAEAKPLLVDALDLLAGNNGGRAGNGAIALLNAGDIVAAFVKIQQAERKLRLAQDKGANTEDLRRELADFVRRMMEERVAHLEALIAADPGLDPEGKIVQIRDFMAQGETAFAQGFYDTAVSEFRQAEQRVLELDREAPEVTWLAPAAFVTNTATPTVVVQYVDLLGLVVRSGVRIYLDGVDRTSQATVGPYQVTLAVAASYALAEGSHPVRVVAPDQAGNVADVSFTLVVDLTPPVVAIDSPAAEALLRTGTFVVSARYSDALSGIDVSTARMVVDGGDLTSQADVTGIGMQVDLQGGLALPDGVGSAAVSVKDRAGNAASASVEFLVDSTQPGVTIQPADGTTIADFPVTFEVRVQDFGSGLADAPVTISMNGQDIASRFAAEVLNRGQVLNVPDVALDIVLRYTPSLEEFVALVRGTGDGVLVMQVDAMDRAGNARRVTGYYPVNLSPGGGGDQVPQVIVLIDAQGISIPPPPPATTKRCSIATHYIVQALDVARGRAPVPQLSLEFESPDQWGAFVEFPPFSTITRSDGLAGAALIAGPTPGTHSLVVSVPDEPSVVPLSLSATANEPSLDPVFDVQLEPGSGATMLIGVHAWSSLVDGEALQGEKVRIGKVNAQGDLDPIDESSFLLMPAEQLTDDDGNAQFLLIASPSVQPGDYTFRAGLSDWPATADFHVTVLNPRALKTSLPSLPDGEYKDRNVYLSVVSGNGQVGVQDTRLGADLVVQLMEDGAPVAPINESYPRYDANRQRISPDFELHIRKVIFTVSSGGGALMPAAGTEVPLEGSGQARVSLTYGFATEPQFVSVSFVVESGVPPDLASVPVAGGATFNEGVPEIRFVDAGSATPVGRALNQSLDALLREGVASAPAFRVEVRWPVGAPAPSDASLQAADECLEYLPEDGRFPPTAQSIPFALAGSTERFSIYRSARVVTTRDSVAEVPSGGNGQDTVVQRFGGHIVVQIAPAGVNIIQAAMEITQPMKPPLIGEPPALDQEDERLRRVNGRINFVVGTDRTIAVKFIPSPPEGGEQVPTVSVATSPQAASQEFGNGAETQLTAAQVQARQFRFTPQEPPGEYQDFYLNVIRHLPVTNGVDYLPMRVVRGLKHISVHVWINADPNGRPSISHQKLGENLRFAERIFHQAGISFDLGTLQIEGINDDEIRALVNLEDDPPKFLDQLRALGRHSPEEAKINLFYVSTVGDANGWAYTRGDTTDAGLGDSILIAAIRGGSPVDTTAHEIGHLLGHGSGRDANDMFVRGAGLAGLKDVTNIVHLKNLMGEGFRRGGFTLADGIADAVRGEQEQVTWCRSNSHLR